MKMQREKMIPLPKSSSSGHQSSSQIRQRQQQQQTPGNPLSQKIMQQVIQRKENSENIKSARDHSNSKSSGIPFKEKDLNTLSTNTPNKNCAPVQVDETLLKNIQTKLQGMEDQISKIEYSQDTMRPMLRQIQTPQG